MNDTINELRDGASCSKNAPNQIKAWYQFILSSRTLIRGAMMASVEAQKSHELRQVIDVIVGKLMV